MVVLGIMLLLLGAALLVAEARGPAASLGAAGGVALTAGALAIAAAASAGTWAVLAITLAPVLATCAWLAVTAHRRPHGRAAAEPPKLDGEYGLVRQWADGDGEVLAGGALWRAHRTRGD